MCGIVGFFNRSGALNPHWNLENLFDSILHWRRKGTDGIGMLVITDDEWYIRKEYLKQSEFIIKYGKELKRLIESHSTRAIIIHNRWATKGVLGINGVHPFVGDRYVLMHNGTISDSVAKKKNIDILPKMDNWKYVAHSDSERMAAYINRSSTLKDSAESVITEMISRVYSKFQKLGVLIIYDTKQDRLYIFRTIDRELVYSYDKISNCIESFWNCNTMADRFSPNVNGTLMHGTLIKVDPNTGKILKHLKLLHELPIPKTSKHIISDWVNTMSQQAKAGVSLAVY